jgi:hypothetical protein
MKLLSSLPQTIISRRNGNIYVLEKNGETVENLRKEKKKYIKIGVLSHNLRGKLDASDQPYKPAIYLFVQDHEIVNGTVIGLERAKQLATHWHGGQWSALYQFGSSGVYLKENHLLYLEEIEQEIYRPETALRPFTRSKKQTNELITLKRFFLSMGNKSGIKTVYTKDKYGIPFPQLHDSFPDEQINTIKEIKRMQ